MDKINYEAEIEITPATMAIFPYLNKQGGLSSRILEEDAEYFVKSRPSKVIDLACRYFGIDLKARQEGTRQMTNWTHKLPISIDSYSHMYFFPSLSPSNPECVWMNHTYIKGIEKIGHQQTKIIFKNSLSSIIGVSYGSIDNQINRTAQYRFILDNRMKRLHGDFQRD